jgi:hypothetical protein
MPTGQVRILVVGPGGTTIETPERIIKAVPWTELPALANIRDFHYVIIHLRDDPSAADELAWARIHGVMSGAPPALSAGCKLLLIGYPGFQVPLGRRSQPEPFLRWLGHHINFAWRTAPGEGIVPTDPMSSADPYLSRVRRYTFTLESAWQNTAPLKVQPLLASIDQLPVAFTTNPPLANLTVYPPIGDVTDQDLIRLALKSFCKVDIGPVPEPEWIASMLAPGEASVDQRIAALSEERAQIDEAYARATATRSDLRSVLRVLYEQGDVLERHTRSLLRKFGAVVHEPAKAGVEDGWLEVDIDGTRKLGVLEIKGTTRDQFSEDGLKQLAMWVLNADVEGKEAVGIFIGASAIGRPVAERPNPFSDGWRRGAERHGLIGMTTADLYRAFELMEAGNLQQDVFWRSVFQTKGIYKSPVANP